MRVSTWPAASAGGGWPASCGRPSRRSSGRRR
jgi:hypothetical protein